MPANTDPIFTRNGAVSSALITAANTSSQGGGTIGTDIFKAFTADATNGSYVRSVWLIPTATAPTTTTATVARVFLSSKTSGSTTSADTILVAELTLPAIAADNASAAAIWFEVPLNIALPAGWTVLATTHAAPAANSAWNAVVFAGDY